MVLTVMSLMVLPALALAGPRSGSSFGGRLGFRSPGASTMPRSYSGGGYGSRYGGGGSSFFFLPGWGWGGGYGMGGGMGLFGTLMLVAVVGIAAVSISRAVRRYRQSGGGPTWSGLDRHFLHASELEFPHPEDRRRVHLRADLPSDLRAVLASATRLTGVE